MIAIISIIIILAAAFIYAKFFILEKPDNLETGGENTMKIKSSAFENNQELPQKYGYKFSNVNPPFSIEGIPVNAKTIVIICDDPDAPSGDFVHWLVFNIPSSSSIMKIDENFKTGINGRNDFGNNRYDGPSPPSGTHRYFFKFYSLDSSLSLVAGASKKDIEKAMQGHILAKGEIIGLFSKS